MPLSYVHYDLQDGYIDNWLVAGPQARSIQDLESYTGEDFKYRVYVKYYEPDSGITRLPVERAHLTSGTFHIGDYEGVWSYIHCQEDHFADQSAYYPNWHYLRSWAYAQVKSSQAQEVLLVLTSYGPADVWLNGEHIHHQEHFTDQFPRRVPFRSRLQAGPNKILVRFEGVVMGQAAHAVALRICEPLEDLQGGQLKSVSNKGSVKISVRIPTLLYPTYRRSELERVFSDAYTDRDVFGREEPVIVQWPEDMVQEAITMVRLQKPNGQIYAESYEKGSRGDRVLLSFSNQLEEGPYHIVMMPSPREYYEKNMRFARHLEVWCTGNNLYSEAPYGSYAERRGEALLNASKRQSNLFAEIATMALGSWHALETKVVLQAVERVNQCFVDSVYDLIGVLGMVIRFGGLPEFPADLQEPVGQCILNYKYWYSEAEPDDANQFSGEGRSILYHACEILAGQRYPEQTFAKSGKDGQWHREHGERLALAWLKQRGAYGFADWDSGGTFADILLALSHLVDLAESNDVFQMASVVMDKVFLTIALNSYKGVFGSTHGAGTALKLKSGLLEPTSGITRLMWGTGIFNYNIAGTVSLACTENYELPSILAEIATTASEEMWSRERHMVCPPTGGEGPVEVNKVTYKTPDYMLCSAQDYRPGQPGNQEHIWQATLGPAAVVFTNHPANASEDDARRPNFWLGNARLPRVAQWKDALIALYNLPEDDWMGFTHAYFPLYAFDENVQRENWAFLRKGNGYLALKAAQGMNLTRGGTSAYRELRSPGRQNVWLCQMGRAALDGDFAAFQDKVLALDLTIKGLSVRWITLRGETLSFSWEGPFLCDGQEQPLGGFKHYENPYTTVELPCSQMEVRAGEYLLRLAYS